MSLNGSAVHRAWLCESLELTDRSTEPEAFDEVSALKVTSASDCLLKPYWGENELLDSFEFAVPEGMYTYSFDAAIC